MAVRDYFYQSPYSRFIREKSLIKDTKGLKFHRQYQNGSESFFKADLENADHVDI